MTQSTPHSAQPCCAHCPCNQASASFGQQLMQHFERLTEQERGQMLQLIDDILAAGRQQPQATATTQRKRNKKR